MTLHVPNIRVDYRSASDDLQNSAKSTAQDTPYAKYLKRFLDVTLVLVSAPMVLPLIAICSLFTALGGGKPFYSQLRVGKHGKTFRIWKLRTMVHDADEALENYLSQNPKARAEWDKTQKLKNDPRITPLGRFLRKTSVDELPQLFNVLNGTMSLVGPRPMMVDQKSKYPGQAYYNMRPGITGLWQISDRNNCSFAHRAYYDDQYNQTMSLKTDAKIIAKTITVVVNATGH